MTVWVHNFLTPLPGGTGCQANAITPDGTKIVGWSSGTGFTSHACLWEKSGDTYGAPVDLGTLTGPAPTSVAYGISSDGTTVFGAASDGAVFPSQPTTRAFLWTSGGGMVALASNAGIVGNEDAAAYCGSHTGATIAGAAVGSGTGNQQPCYWTLSGSVITPLPTIGGPADADTQGSVLACADDASVFAGTVSSDLGGNTYAVIWSGVGHTATDLGDLGGGTYAIANGISAAGTTVVGQALDSGSVSHAFSWTSGGGMVDLGVPAGASSALAQSISGDGLTVGGTAIGGADLCWLWTAAGGFVQLPVTTTGSVQGLSSDGSVPVGYVEAVSPTLAVRWGPAVPPPTPAILNMDNVIVTCLATESPCTVAQYTTPPPFAGPALGLRWSDTRGATWGNAVPRPFSTDPLWQPRWNRTGYARDRVFELFWSAALKTALNGAFVETVPWQS